MLLMSITYIDGNDVTEITYRRLCRIIDVSRLAGMLRDFPLTYFTEEERAAVIAFERFMVSAENRAFPELGF